MTVAAKIERRPIAPQAVVAEPYEWEPRARCHECANVQSRIRVCPKCRGVGRLSEGPCPRCDGLGAVRNKRGSCDRCGGAGFVGEARPQETMLAVDIAWSDEGHARLIGPRTTRKRGEALYRLHRHDSVIIAGVPN